jgi:hypothetical protein
MSTSTGNKLTMPLEGIHRIQVTVQGQVHDLIEGLNEVQINILRWFGDEVCRR